MTWTGLIVAAAVLVLGTIVGVWHRRSQGRLRTVGTMGAARVPRPRGDGLGSAWPAGAASGEVGESMEMAASADGSVVIDGAEVPDPAVADPSEAGRRLDAGLLAALGVEPAQATLLQFSSAFCAPCRALRRVSAEVAELLPAVRHVEVDAESHLDAVRALGIWKTPTLLVLDSTGQVVKRATGVPGKAQLIAVLGEILPAV
jgi:thiol-disulfide isomerase/thioredoxin